MLMKKYVSYLSALLSMVVCTTFCTSCQDEDEMEDKILTGVCWEGKLPVRSSNGREYYFSRFFFYEDRGYLTGYEESYYKGEYDSTYEFEWYWLDEAWRVLVLNYGGRWNEDVACISISKVTNNYIYGHYFTSLEEYYEACELNLVSTRGSYIELEHVSEVRHTESVATDTEEKTDSTSTDSYVRPRG